MKILPILCSCFCAVSLLASCDKGTNTNPDDNGNGNGNGTTPTGIVLSHTATTRSIGAEFTVKALLMPAATSEGITWTSSNPTVASVEGGVFTALSSGTSTLTASAEGVESVTCVLSVESSCRGANNLSSGVGTASFKTATTWKVGEQEWSDIVLASACTAKTTFLGGNEKENKYNVDCRSNPGYGDLFSWCAVIKYQDVLCPDGWRVPTKNEFIALDKEFGFPGTFAETTRAKIDETYLNPTVWGGTLPGYCSDEEISMMGQTIPSGKLFGQNVSASYWAVDEYSGGNGTCNYISTAEDDYGTKPVVQADCYMSNYDQGQSLRCIKTI